MKTIAINKERSIMLVSKVIIYMMIIMGGTNLIAQNDTEGANIYRVTAYQNGNSKIVSLSNEARILPAAALFIPNAFTPNGDGLNETFGPKGEGITDFKMQVFDRWGNLIFESNKMEIQWDGYHDNEMAATGVYVYKITAKGQGNDGSDKKLINETGTVTLVL